MVARGTASIARDGHRTRSRAFARVVRACSVPRTSARVSQPQPSPKKRMLHCYIRTLIDNARQFALATHPKFNRQPRRLEFSVSHRKQTPGTRLNRQLFHTFADAFRAHNI
jgi:hypothetical protein